MAHIQTNVLKADEEPEEPAVTRQRSEAYRGSPLQDKELMRIFEMTYGPIKRRSGEALHTPKPTGNSPKPGKAAPCPKGRNICWWMDTISSLRGRSWPSWRKPTWTPPGTGSFRSCATTKATGGAS